MGYKMKHTGVPALLKALVGDQHKLPENLKQAILDAPAKMTNAELKKNKETMDYRQGKGRADVTKKGSVVKGSKDRKIGEGMGPTGTKKAGSAGTRVVKEGHTSAGTKTGSSQQVVKEKKASQIKKRGYNLSGGTKKSAGKAAVKMYGKKK